MEWRVWITWWIIFCIRYSKLFWIHLETVIDKPSKNIYVNKIENRIIFKIKTGYYVELLMPKTLKLLRSANSKITKDENTENMPCLEITELVLIR